MKVLELGYSRKRKLYPPNSPLSVAAGHSCLDVRKVDSDGRLGGRAFPQLGGVVMLEEEVRAFEGSVNDRT